MMTYKDEDGKEYKISWSEKLQLKNLHAAKKHTQWLRMHFYTNIILIAILLVLTAGILYVLYRLDQVNFFTSLLWG